MDIQLGNASKNRTRTLPEKKIRHQFRKKKEDPDIEPTNTNGCWISKSRIREFGKEHKIELGLVAGYPSTLLFLVRKRLLYCRRVGFLLLIQCRRFSIDILLDLLDSSLDLELHARKFELFGK